MISTHPYPEDIERLRGLCVKMHHDLFFSRCVTAQRSLLESGTMGTKGHTQVIVAHLTESYTSQVCITVKAPITAAADDSLEYFFFFFIVFQRK